MKILITGGTGSVGQELLRVFCSDGYDTVFTFFSNAAKAEELAKTYAAKAVCLKNDCVLPNDFDIIINNVGIVNSLALCEDVDIGKWEETLRVNLTLPFIIIKSNLAHMKAQKFGRIINIASIYGVRAEEEVAPYATSKHGLIGLTKVVAKEYGRFGITCNAICPGTIRSEMSDRIADYYTHTPEERKAYFELLTSAVPNRRLVEPTEVANFVHFIASAEASNINGATLMIDGGYTA